MSDSYAIGCIDCKGDSLTIGQAAGGSPFCFYSGEPQTMKELRDFLYKHWGHHLEFGLSEKFWDMSELSADQNPDPDSDANLLGS